MIFSAPDKQEKLQFFHFKARSCFWKIGRREIRFSFVSYNVFFANFVRKNVIHW